MRRLIALTAGLCLALTIVGPVAAADPSSTIVRINPFHMTTATAAAGDTVVLEAGWGACTKGLAVAFSRAAHLDWSIDGEPFPTTPVWTMPEPVPATGDPNTCVNGTSTGWRTYGQYPTTFASGVYVVSLIAWTTHAFLDGGDYDGDGRPDFTGHVSWYAEASLTLTVN